MEIENFGKNLKHFRILSGLTQEQASEKIGVTYSYYTKLESGNDTPGIDALIATCKAFNIPIEYLLKDNGYREFQIYSCSHIYKDLQSLDDNELNMMTDTLFRIHEQLKILTEKQTNK